jgi:hypothetical protein
MKDVHFKKGLDRATRYQDYNKSAKARYANKAREKFGGQWILPFVIIVSDIYGNMNEYASSYAKKRRHKEIENIEQETVSLNRSLARWTFALAFFSILTFFVSFGTLVVLFGQLREMKSGSKDTARLVRASIRQAKAAADQASNLKIVADNAKTSASAAATSAQSAKRSVETTEELSRPRIVLNSATFDAATKTIKYSLSNIGNTAGTIRVMATECIEGDHLPTQPVLHVPDILPVQFLITPNSLPLYSGNGMLDCNVSRQVDIGQFFPITASENMIIFWIVLGYDGTLENPTLSARLL